MLYGPSGMEGKTTVMMNLLETLPGVVSVFTDNPFVAKGRTLSVEDMHELASSPICLIDEGDFHGGFMEGKTTLMMNLLETLPGVVSVFTDNPFVAKGRTLSVEDMHELASSPICLIDEGDFHGGFMEGKTTLMMNLLETLPGVVSVFTDNPFVAKGRTLSVEDMHELASSPICLIDEGDFHGGFMEGKTTLMMNLLETLPGVVSVFTDNPFVAKGRTLSVEDMHELASSPICLIDEGDFHGGFMEGKTTLMMNLLETLPGVVSVFTDNPFVAKGRTLSVEDMHELASSPICLIDEGDFHGGFIVDNLRRMMSGFLYRVKGLSFIMDKLAICSTNRIGFSSWEMITYSLARRHDVLYCGKSMQHLESRARGDSRTSGPAPSKFP